MEKKLGQHPTQNNTNTETEPVASQSGDRTRAFKGLMSWNEGTTSTPRADAHEVPGLPVENPPYDNTSIPEAIDRGELSDELPEGVTVDHFVHTKRDAAVEPEVILPPQKEKWSRGKKIAVAAVAGTMAPVVGLTLWAFGSSDSDAKGPGGSQPVPAEQFNPENGVTLPNKKFSSERPSNDAPQSVVEHGLFQTLSPEKQKEIRRIEAMDINTFRTLDQATKTAYSQFMLNANAPYTFYTYNKYRAQWGYPSITDEAKDAYLNGVTAETSADALEAVFNLKKVAITTLYETYNGQDLTDTTHYTQGEDKDYVFNLLEAKKLIDATVDSETSDYDVFLTQKVGVVEPGSITDYCYVTDSTPMFESKNFSIFQTGSEASTKNLNLRIVHCDSNKPGGPAVQHIYRHTPITTSFLPNQPSDRYVAPLARSETADSPSYYKDLRMFEGRGYGY